MAHGSRFTWTRRCSNWRAGNDLAALQASCMRLPRSSSWKLGHRVSSVIESNPYRWHSSSFQQPIAAQSITPLDQASKVRRGPFQRDYVIWERARGRRCPASLCFCVHRFLISTKLHGSSARASWASLGDLYATLIACNGFILEDQ